MSAIASTRTSAAATPENANQVSRRRVQSCIFLFFASPVNADFQTFSTQFPATKAAPAKTRVAATFPMSMSVLTPTILASVSPITPEAGPRLSRARRISSTKAARAQRRVVWTLTSLIKQSAMKRTPINAIPALTRKCLALAKMTAAATSTTFRWIRAAMAHQSQAS